MKLEIATTLAESLVHQMQRHCERIEICGSIRRGKKRVKDIEIVAAPRWSTMPKIDTLFLEEQRVNDLWNWAQLRSDHELIQWIKPGTSEAIDWPIKPDGKYWRGVLRTGIKLDLFLCRLDNFGLHKLIRTGSSEYSKAIVTHARARGTPCTGGFITGSDGEPVPMPEEEDVFRYLGIQYVEPAERIDATALKLLGVVNHE